MGNRFMAQLAPKRRVQGCFMFPIGALVFGPMRTAGLNQNCFYVKALQTMATKAYDCTSSGRKNSSLPDVLRTQKPEAKHTIFAQKWTLVIADEAHEMRTTNSKWVGMRQLQEVSELTVLVTGTPLYTGARVSCHPALPTRPPPLTLGSRTSSTLAASFAFRRYRTKRASIWRRRLARA